MARSSAGLSAAGPGPRRQAEAALAAPDAGHHAARASDPGRVLQLVLGCLWLFDAILQFQAFMFGRGFAAMLRQTAPGNPASIAGPIAWSARLIAQHAVLANAAFAAIQLAIALGIAWRPTLRLALGLSVGWSLAVWWLGEGFGGLLTGTASPVSGAPGGVVLYALLAILLWPPRRERQARFVAARVLGAPLARLAWLIVWASLAVLAALPPSMAPRALAAVVARAAAGQPGWLAGLDQHLAMFLSRNGPAAAITLSVALAVVAGGIYLPRPACRAVLALAVVTAAALWLAQGLGGLLTGTGTDPGTAPLLALLALAYWPLRPGFGERSGTAGDVGSFAIMGERG